MMIFQRACISPKSMHIPKCICQSVCLHVDDCLIGLAVHSPSACEQPFPSLGKCHFITSLKKGKMMLNRLVQIQVKHLSENITPAPRPGQCYMLSTALLPSLSPGRAAFHIPIGATTDLLAGPTPRPSPCTQKCPFLTSKME